MDLPVDANIALDAKPDVSPARSWRTAALVTAAIAALELVALLLFVLVFTGNPAPASAKSTRGERVPATAPAAAKPAKTHPAKPPAPKPAVPQLSRSRTSVLVLNGNGVSGMATSVADSVRAMDYLIAGIANAPRNDFRRSLIMYRAGFRGEAERLARDLRVRRVSPLDGLRPGDLQGAHVALIVGG